MQLGSPRPVQGALFGVDAPTTMPPPAGWVPSRRYVQPPEQLPLWETPDSVHLSQFRSDRLPDGYPLDGGNGNCGPTSAVMALRLVGRDVPGFHGEDSQRVIDAARRLATGRVNQAEWTTVQQMEDVLRVGGAALARTNSPDVALQAVRQGKVLLALGNTNDDHWWSRPFGDPDTPESEWGGHFVVVSAHHPKRDMYTVNDPARTTPVHMSGDQLRSFLVSGARAGAAALIVDGPGDVVRNAATERPVAG